MTTMQIHIPDDRAAALRTAAAAQGMTLERWIQKLTEEAATREGLAQSPDDPLWLDAPAKVPEDARPIWEVILDNMRDVTPEEFSRLPKDGASEHDHYLYGHPKRRRQ